MTRKKVDEPAARREDAVYDWDEMQARWEWTKKNAPGNLLITFPDGQSVEIQHIAQTFGVLFSTVPEPYRTQFADTQSPFPPGEPFEDDFVVGSMALRRFLKQKRK